MIMDWICAKTASSSGFRTVYAVIPAIVLTFGAFKADACTTFSLGNSAEKAFGKSYDWNLSHGFVVGNKRNMSKTAFALLPGDKPTSWTSKFGSVTFNQYGREFPNGGINEAGLTVEVMILGDTKYPAAGFSVAWNQIECLAHVLNLAAQEILNNFKQRCVCS